MKTLILSSVDWISSTYQPVGSDPVYEAHHILSLLLGSDVDTCCQVFINGHKGCTPSFSAEASLSDSTGVDHFAMASLSGAGFASVTIFFSGESCASFPPALFPQFPP